MPNTNSPLKKNIVLYEETKSINHYKTLYKIITLFVYRNVWVLIFLTQWCPLCSTEHANYSYVQEYLDPVITSTVMYSLQYSTCKLFLCTGILGSCYTLHSYVLSAVQYMQTILMYRNVWVLIYPTQLCTLYRTVQE